MSHTHSVASGLASDWRFPDDPSSGRVAYRPYEALAERKAKKEKGLWRLAPGQAKL